ncbi:MULTISPECIES: hypothetical protein [Bacillus cereus group]|uniref:hypothetical protein n=1 Tax=Bacillus cereus group TaxID=86661 RepID=UPI0005ABA522|nr:hypothetical protein DN397_18185 [Bacillus sp. AY1-10]
MEDVDVGIVTNVVAKRNRSAIVKSVAARRNRNVIVKNAIVNRKGINNKKSTLSTLSFYKVIFHHQQIFLQFSIYLVF